MRHETEAEAAALGDIAATVAVLLERLRAACDPTERATLTAKFKARVDRIREDLGRRHGLDEVRAGAVIARSLARVIEVVQATPSRA